eukprot:4173135-Pleurochrysis_carterae.AAC.1
MARLQTDPINLIEGALLHQHVVNSMRDPGDVIAAAICLPNNALNARVELAQLNQPKDGIA